MCLYTLTDVPHPAAALNWRTFQMRGSIFWPHPKSVLYLTDCGAAHIHLHGLPQVVADRLIASVTTDLAIHPSGALLFYLGDGLTLVDNAEKHRAFLEIASSHAIRALYRLLASIFEPPEASRGQTVQNCLESLSRRWAHHVNHELDCYLSGNHPGGVAQDPPSAYTTANRIQAELEAPSVAMLYDFLLSDPSVLAFCPTDGAWSAHWEAWSRVMAEKCVLQGLHSVSPFGASVAQARIEGPSLAVRIYPSNELDELGRPLATVEPFDPANDRPRRSLVEVLT